MPAEGINNMDDEDDITNNSMNIAKSVKASLIAYGEVMTIYSAFVAFPIYAVNNSRLLSFFPTQLNSCNTITNMHLPIVSGIFPWEKDFFSLLHLGQEMLATLKLALVQSCTTKLSLTSHIDHMNYVSAA